MKIRKEYAVTVLPHRGVAVLTSKNNSWVSWLQGSASVGVQIYDCTFQQAVHNLKYLSEKGYTIQKRRRGK